MFVFVFVFVFVFFFAFFFVVFSFSFLLLLLLLLLRVTTLNVLKMMSLIVKGVLREEYVGVGVGGVGGWGVKVHPKKPC